MFDRKSFNLIGPVHTVSAEFSNIGETNGEYVATRTVPGGYMRFDLDGRLLEEISPDRELIDDVYRDVYIYDSSPFPREREEYFRDGSMQGKTAFAFHEDGGRLERDFYLSEKGELTLGGETAFDPDGTFVSAVHFDMTGRVVSSNTYDPARVRKRSWEAHGSCFVEERFYSERLELTHSKITELNERGDERSWAHYDENGNMYNKSEHEYEYDSIGNWVVLLQTYWVVGWGSFKLVPFTKTTRRIEYYS